MFRDAVHGDVVLTAEEVRLLDTPDLQRLRGIRQLGTAYLVFPSAHHTRFEHSIGTLEMARRLVAAVAENEERDPGRCVAISPEEERVIRFAALLHDVTHIPFGHNIEDQTGLFERHDTPARFLRALDPSTRLGEVLDDLGVREAVLDLLLPAGHPARGTTLPYGAEILSDTICADILDYLARDAHFTGLNLYYDDRIVRHFRVDRASGHLFLDLAKRRLLREDILSEIVRVLEARYYFSERVYYHHAKITAGALLAKAAETAIASGALREEDFYDTTDASLLERLEGAPYPDSAARERVWDLIGRFRDRRLFKRACVFPVYENAAFQERVIAEYFGRGTFEARLAVEGRLAERARRHGGRDAVVSLYCPARRMQLKEAKIHVRWPGEEAVHPLEAYAERVPRLRDLENAYRNLWKCYVLAAPGDPVVLRAVQRAAAEEFPDATNVYEIET